MIEAGIKMLSGYLGVLGWPSVSQLLGQWWRCKVNEFSSPCCMDRVLQVTTEIGQRVWPTLSGKLAAWLFKSLVSCRQEPYVLLRVVMGVK